MQQLTMKKILLTSVLVCFYGALAVLAGPGFPKTIGKGSFEEAKAIVQLPDGAYMVAGRVVEANGTTDLHMVKISAQGETVWDFKFGGPENEDVHDMAVGPNGSVVVLGSSDSYDVEADMKDVWAIKVDATGKLLWNKHYGLTATSIDEGTAIVPAHGGGYLLAGTTIDLNAPQGQSSRNSALLMLLDEQGNRKWQKTFSGPKSEEASALVRTETGYMLVVNTESYGRGKWDAWMIGLDKAGEKQWEAFHGGGDTDQIKSAIAMPDGGFLLVGHSYTFAEASNDMWVVRTNAKGQQLWQRNYGGLGTDDAACVVAMKDGYALVGTMEVWENDGTGGNASNEQHNLCVLKLNDKGEKLWMSSLGGPGEQRGFGLVCCPDDTLIAVGTTSADDSKQVSMFLVKVGPNGQ